MNIRVYSMFDRKARAFGALMAFVNDDVARRAVLSILRGDDGEITRFPGDFDLHFLGEMDTDTGVISAGVPCLVFNVADLLRGQQEA